MNHHVFVYVSGTEDFMTDQANPVLSLIVAYLTQPLDIIIFYIKVFADSF